MSEMSNQLVPSDQNEVSKRLAQMNEGLFRYLRELGLPCDSVLVDLDERQKVVQNMPAVVDRLTADQKTAASYVSKFIAAVAIGLFDAALNYLWNETIRNLRQKIAQFDLQYFFDTAIKEPNNRTKYTSEADLAKLPDWEFIRGCQEIGLISELGFKHLDFIRDVRNFSSAAHPNQNQLTGFQLVDWMDTCIREVLAREPSHSAVEAKRLLRNLREQELDRQTAAPVNAALAELDADRLLPVLRTVFGMYVDPNLSAQARENIRLVRETLWNGCTDDARHEIGLKYSSYSAHGETDRAELAKEFLEAVGGLTYLPQDSLALEISGAIDSLMSAHNALNNFYNEHHPAAALEKLVPESGTVPDSIRTSYVKCITLCKLTNTHGVARTAEPIYDRIMNTWQTKEILTFLAVTLEPELQSRLRATLCSQKFHEVATNLIARTSHALALKGLKFISEFEPEFAGRSVNASRFKDVVSQIKRAS